MPRPRLRRWVADIPKVTYFKPQGVPLPALEEIRLSIEGLEALRLADLEGLTAEEAAFRMGVSRHTFGRVLAEARAKVARALVAGAALRIEGGHYEVAGEGNDARRREAGCACDGADRTTGRTQEDAMRQGGRGKGQGRCGQGHGQGGRGGGKCGQGRGLGQAGQAVAADGGTGTPQAGAGLCVCPQCGQTVPHTPGNPCTARHCPACGAAMTRQ